MFVTQVNAGIFYFILVILTGTGLFYFIVHRWFRQFYKNLHVSNIQSLGVQIAQVIAAILILKALGHNQSISPYIFIFLISSVVAVIPFTIGGVGAREMTFLYAADILRLDLNTSVALSLLFFLITALVSLTGIVYMVYPRLINKAQSR
jgi:uncharacterized protein (TIRG00374 family)